MANPDIPGHSIPTRPGPEAAGVHTGAAQTLDKGLLALAFLSMAVTAMIDNLRPPMLPVVAGRVGLDYGQTASFVSAVSVGALLLTSISTRLLVLWPQRRFLALAAALQAAAAVVTAFAGSLPALMTAGLLWGAGNAGLGLSSNLFAIASSPPRLRARSMSALHIFYGVFATLPAMYFPWAVLRMPFPTAILLPFIVLLFPLALAYSRPEEVRPVEDAAALKSESFGLDAWLLVAAISIYVVGEVVAAVWSVTWLVSRGWTLAQAGHVLAGLFAGLAAGRLLTVFFLRPAYERILPILSILAGGAVFSASLAGWEWGIAWLGFVLAPTFPLLASMLVSDYPKRYRKLMGYEYTAMMLALALSHLLFGRLSDALGVAKAFSLPAFCFFIAAGLLAIREFKRKKTAQP